MPYDTLITINIHGPFTTSQAGRAVIGPVIDSRNVWVDRMDGGTRLAVAGVGLFETQQVVVYRMRYYEPYLTHDISLIAVFDSLPFNSDTGIVSTHRLATPYSIHLVLSLIHI